MRSQVAQGGCPAQASLLCHFWHFPPGRSKAHGAAETRVPVKKEGNTRMRTNRWMTGLLAGILAAGVLGGGMPLAGQAAGKDNKAALSAEQGAATVTAPDGTVRNAAFTTMAQMKEALGAGSTADWSPRYTTVVESSYWNFADASQYGSTALTIGLAVNAYRNLDMLLDCGYTLDYQALADYTESYRQKLIAKKKEAKAAAGQAAAGTEDPESFDPDEFYSTLVYCLGSPYLLNKPKAKVTASTYNGRDYSKVFDAAYYYSHYSDVRSKIGNDPPELLRHFVEVGVAEGRQGCAGFDVRAYAAAVDAQLGTKYSYSYANYFGRYLGRYVEASETGISENAVAQQAAEAGTAIGSAAQTAAGSEGEFSPAAYGQQLTGQTYVNNSLTSVYTGLPVTAALANQRPLAVMMPTDEAAQPSYGISRADVLYEIMEEGGISRQMAIIPDWQDLPRIGNLRSCRLYYLYAAREWDPILIHFGGVAYMKGTIDAGDITNLSGTYEYGTGGAAPGAGYFYRTKDRTAPHNAYISAAGIDRACASLGYPLTLRADYYNRRHFNFVKNGLNDLSQYGAAAVSAQTVDLSRVFSYTRSALYYDAAEGVYRKTLHGKKQVDGINGQQLTFTNVIIQNTQWRQLDRKGYLSFDMLGTQDDGWYCTKGKAIHVTWFKVSPWMPTLYYDDSGNEIEMNPGKTYIAVAQAGKNVVLR